MIGIDRGWGVGFVEKIKSELGIKALHRGFEQIGEVYALRERSEPYAIKFTGQTEALSAGNTILWDEAPEGTGI